MALENMTNRFNNQSNRFHKKSMVVRVACLSLSLCLLPFFIFPSQDNQTTTEQSVAPKNKQSAVQGQQAQEPAIKKKTKETDQEESSINKQKKSSSKSKQALKPTPKIPTKIDPAQRLALHEEKRTIKNIHIQGNNVISKDAILHKLPVKVGDTFNINLTASMIKNLYKLGYFHQIKIFAEPIGDDEVNVHVVVEEKPKVNTFIFVGNKAISEKELKEQLQVENITTLAKEELKPFITKIKKHYHKKNYHNVEVEAKITPETEHTVAVEFIIKEGKKSYLNRISFKGNKHISGKKLKRIIYSQEDWLFSFINRGGVYNAEMMEGDKYMIEDVYRNNGFVNAKVVNIEVERDPATTNHHIIYTVHEGERYRIKDIEIEGNDIVPSQRLRAVIPLYEGQIYSSENLRTSLENLRMVWGEYGYIFADIEPNVSIDEESKTISIIFNTDIKDQVYLNRITIRGNKKTRDKVIRRQILLEEGTLITNQKMEVSKACVGLLGYFDPKNGVTWKTTRIDDTHADLDLMLTEVKTGSFSTNISFGGTPGKMQTPTTGLSANVSFGDKNFLGSGIGLAASTDISQRYKSFQGSISNPWLFDRPIRGSLAGFIRSSEYDDQINIAEHPPVERVVGGIAGIGYVTRFLNSVIIDGKIHVENITYSDPIRAASRFSKGDQFIAQVLLNKYFQEGNQISLIGSFSQDRRNGTVFPTTGYQWNWFTQWSFPGWKQRLFRNDDDCCKQPRVPNCTTFNYIKSELDVSWYTPLIGEHDLILCLHGNFGIVHPFRGKDIPWKNLYHVGGPQSIRGYTYGQVGPTWKEDSLGASKAFFVNVEFIIPVSANLNTRAVIFYDGGAGWDTPYRCEFIEAARKVGLSFEKDFANNNFFYRHCVGVGVRMKSPSPFQVDFGIKLNPSKKYRKHLTELHFSMDHSF